MVASCFEAETGGVVGLNPVAAVVVEAVVEAVVEVAAVEVAAVEAAVEAVDVADNSQ